MDFAFSNEKAEQIDRQRLALFASLRMITSELVQLAPSLANEKAQEYLLHGVCRRLKIVRRCLMNVFRIFPLDRRKLLTMDERDEIEINLHAFIVHIYGLLDNMAWVFVLDRSLLPKIEKGKLGVDLFKSETQKYLPADLARYLKTERVSVWHSRYAKDYRDALAHRIPLYVPPANVRKSDEERYWALEREIHAAKFSGRFKDAKRLESEQAALQSICFNFVHSRTEAKGKAFIHSQMITDVTMVLALLRKLKCYLGPVNRAPADASPDEAEAHAAELNR